VGGVHIVSFFKSVVMKKLVFSLFLFTFISIMSVAGPQGNDCTKAVSPNPNLGKCSRVAGTLLYECIVPHETRNCNGVVTYG
jgi:hypothetical protein